ncbi:membrane protein [Terasakiella brassicae]|uniref:Membrane protein n=1 Tax=Terasakiella brassicae TaxID=1634917 RepID=A0A917F7V0_9PROT|nr:Bax inhibitor-1/YccA family protein [Terasakiella brassicae]GGF54156.1 membrane protein [Terasakiella brassicae]
MQFGNDRQSMSHAEARVSQYDVGLRKYMLGVYNYMAAALALTGIVAMLASTSAPLMQTVHGTPLKWVVMLAPLGFVFFLSARIHKMSNQAAQMTFWAFACLMGLSLSYIFLAYTGTSIARTFFVTAVSFGALSLYGYTTKRDLSGMGTFLFMGVVGLILASLVNLFLQSSMMHMVISAIGVLLFAGLTAYDTQRIKDIYNELDSSDIAGKKAIMGALTLYLDFINMFMFLLSFLGNRE